MALGDLLIKGLSTAAGKAYNAYKTAEENKKKTNNTTTSNKQNVTTPTVADHQNYINQNYAGGMDAYTKLQQERLNGAYATGDQGLINRLNQDATTRGYSLNTPQQFVNPYDSYIEQIEKRYASYNNQIEDANRAAVHQGVNRLQNQIPGLNQGYDEAARQAYISSMQAKKVLPQQLAMQGATGGATETAMLGLDTAYQSNLSDINTARQNSIQDINNAIVDLKNSGDLNTAEQILQNNQAALSAYQNMLNNSASYNQWLANFNANRADASYDKSYQDKLFDYNVGRDNIVDKRYDDETAYARNQQEYNNILNRLSMGLITPNDAVALGVPAQDVQAFVNRINQMSDLELKAMQANLANTIASTNKINASVSSSKKENTETTPITTANKYLSQGNRQKAIETLSAIYTNEQIKQYLKDNGYRTDDIDWGIEEASNQYFENPLLSVGNLVNYFKSQGLSNQEIAERLNRNQ